MQRLMRVVVLYLGAGLALLGVLAPNVALGGTPPPKPSSAKQPDASQPDKDHGATDTRPQTQVDFEDNQTLTMDSRGL